jgi:hypothetical protein
LLHVAAPRQAALTPLAAPSFAGVESNQTSLTTGLVINSGTGQGVPVFWMVHASQSAETLTACLDNLAVQLTGSPHHAAWPGAPPGPEATAASADVDDAAALPVHAVLPSAIVIDVSYSEAAAIRSCWWGNGYAGLGQPIGAPARVVYCLWHLTMAWSKNVHRHVRDPVLASEIKGALHTLHLIPVRFCSVV